MTEVLRTNEGLTVRQAAEQLGVSYQTIHNWIAKGQLPATKFGGSGRIIRIHPADLEAVRRPA